MYIHILYIYLHMVCELYILHYYVNFCVSFDTAHLCLHQLNDFIPYSNLSTPLLPLLIQFTVIPYHPQRAGKCSLCIFKNATMEVLV